MGRRNIRHNCSADYSAETTFGRTLGTLIKHVQNLRNKLTNIYDIYMYYIDIFPHLALWVFNPDRIDTHREGERRGLMMMQAAAAAAATERASLASSGVFAGGAVT